MVMVLLLWSLVGLDLVPAQAQVGQADALPTPTDPGAAAQAGADAGPEQSPDAPNPGVAAEGAPAPSIAAEVAGRPGFVTYRVFATQYEPHVVGAVEVAVPDRCVKFASLGNTSALANANCGPGYGLGLDYRVSVTRDTGQSATIPVKEVGPWNLDDNYWNANSGTPRPRRRFTDLPTGKPEAQAAFYEDYNPVTNCKDLAQNPTTKTDGADQFGRCVLNPAGIDLSVAAATQLGLRPLENTWLTVSFLWEPTESTYVGLTPARVLDTRTGTGAPQARLGAGQTIDVPVIGVGGVPAMNVAAVVLNVTATDMVGPDTFLTVFPTGAPRPLASNLNVNQGETVPNLVVARVGAGGRVSIYNGAGSVSVVADVQGWYSTSGAGSRYTSLTPSRVLDTRDGTGGTTGTVGGGQEIELNLNGAGGLPTSSISAVVLNVTAVEPSGPDSFVTVYPAAASRPVASNLNVSQGRNVPNLVVAMVSEGRVKIYNNAGSVHLVADVQGWYGGGGTMGYVSTAPIRALDTRSGTGAVAGKVGPGATIELPVGGVNGVPAGVRGVVLNVTVTEHAGPESYLTVYPAAGARPLASNLNFVDGQTRANLVFARVGDNGRVAFYNNLGAVHVVADLQGWFP